MIIALIVIGFLLYVISSATKGKREAKRKQRHDDDMKLRLAELREQGRIEAARLLAVEKEAMRLAKEQERQAREQERQAEQLAKHEKRIADLEFRMTQAEEDISHWSEQLGNLYALLDMAELHLSGTVNGSREQERYQKKVISLTNQIHTAEGRIAKAKHIKAMAVKELSA